MDVVKVADKVDDAVDTAKAVKKGWCVGRCQQFDESGEHTKLEHGAAKVLEKPVADECR